MNEIDFLEIDLIVADLQKNCQDQIQLINVLRCLRSSPHRFTENDLRFCILQVDALIPNKRLEKIHDQAKNFARI